MGAIELREYQRAALDAIASGWREFRRQLLVLPTGTGKTIVFAHAAMNEIDRGGSVLVLAHRDELILQAIDKLRAACGIDALVEKGGLRALDSFRAGSVVVASVQSLHIDRLIRWPRDSFDLIIVDEAHHALSDSYRNIFTHFDAVAGGATRLLGVTATPDRGDRRALGGIFETIAYEYRMRDAISAGHLCPIVASSIPIEIDMRGVRRVGGDYDAEASAARIAPVLERVADAVVEFARGRKTLVFLPLISLSMAFSDLLRDRGMHSVHVDGESPDRRDILDWFAGSSDGVLCNASLLLEGYDCPDISCVICLRPTQIRSLYQQMVGRGTRIAPGKKNLLLIDFLWLTEKHRLCVPASLIAPDAQHASEIMDAVRSSGDGVEVDLIEAESAAVRERMRRLRDELDRHKRRPARLGYDPLEYGARMNDIELVEWEPVMPWHSLAPTEKQKDALTRLGFDANRVRFRGQASALLTSAARRRELGLCTIRQARLLERHGHANAINMSFAEASAAIDAIARRLGWRSHSQSGAAS